MLLQPPKYFEEKEKIIYSVAWATDNEISLTWESRHQNYSLVSICDTGAACRDSLVMTEPNGWMDLDHSPLFTEDGRQFAMILSSEGMVIRVIEFSSRGTKRFFPKNQHTKRKLLDFANCIGVMEKCQIVP